MLLRYSKKFTRKNLEYGAAIATILTLPIAFLSWQYPRQPDTDPAPMHHEISFSQSKLLVSGSGATINIQEGNKNTPFQGSVVSSAGAKNVFYLPKNQDLVLLLTGAGIDVVLDKNIAQQIHTMDTGAGNSISVR